MKSRISPSQVISASYPPSCGSDTAVESGSNVPWVEILKPLPAQLFEEGTFRTITLAFKTHGIEMGQNRCVAHVYVLRYYHLQTSSILLPDLV